ncbi:hypothetical protein Pst134EA_011712 [Puccinia striiformis f. sp. tritici]|uniref:Secreted protein n=3 Tax=Puccinia striiformis TaxID=27350 RepID=A0A0L0UNG0_9BASI|nr:hypothetical protein Pst134EA_011712 [Puccinia striiformis f. sp. tritici]KAH9468090.1 hypothetical protein Pst134EA_011712 [Puccinia striiformis f. sp. tritici]KAI9605277.1 hypothetical protein H4Q26_003258 [Puccinia striiformis f. sp. tritici PST-130]KNE88563.1 hypothetical protein PSTG_18028 [Puccinia striiformis f. sp. tritici PST-78]POV97161.1 hypothetical protein PSHT_14721 [Puccinia striiformis]
MSVRVSLPILTILVALVGLIQADCPIDKPNLWCGTTSGASTTKDCRLHSFQNGCQNPGPGRRGPELKCCVPTLIPAAKNDNVDCQAYAHQCSSY